MVIDQLFITLGLEPQGIKQGLQKAESYVANGVSSLMGLFAPLVGGAFLAESFSTFNTNAKEIGKSADLLGLSVEEMQAWQNAAVAMGAEGTEINEMLIDMNEYLVDMVEYGSGPAVDVLNSLGISATDAAGNIRPATDVLLDMAKAGEKVSKQQMLAYGKIMGFDKTVIDMLMQGEQALIDMLKAGEELAVYTKDDAELAKKASVANQTLFKSFEAINAIIMRAVMPAYTALVEGISKFVIFLKKNERFTKMFFSAIGIAVGALAIKVSIAFAPMIALFTAIGAVVAAVALVIDDFITYLEGGESAFEDFWKIFGSGEDIMNFFVTTWEKLKNIFSLCIDQVKNIIDLFAALFVDNGEPPIVRIQEPLKKIYETAVQIYKAFLDLIGIDFDGIWQGIKTAFNQAYNSALEELENIKLAIVNAFSNAVSMVSNMFSELFKGLTSKLTGLLDDAWKGVTGFLGFGDDDDEDNNDETAKEKPKKEDGGFFNFFGSDDEEEVNNGALALAGAGGGVNDALLYSAASHAPSQGRISNTISNNSTVGTVVINTQASDANGIARDISPALQRESNSFMNSSNMGVIK